MSVRTGQPQRQASWSGELSNLLIGSYEDELHPAIETVIARSPRIVVDVGCAEGYYAIGLALRLPEAQVFAYDIDPEAQRICVDNARLNGVEGRVHVRGRGTAVDMEHLSGRESLFILDCEGAELELLDPAKAPGLAHTTILVELHDFADLSTTATILGRFDATHEATLFQSEPKDPFAYQPLNGLTKRQRSAAVNEGRPTWPHPMEWALLIPRS